MTSTTITREQAQAFELCTDRLADRLVAQRDLTIAEMRAHLAAHHADYALPPTSATKRQVALRVVTLGIPAGTLTDRVLPAGTILTRGPDAGLSRDVELHQGAVLVAPGTALARCLMVFHRGAWVAPHQHGIQQFAVNAWTPLTCPDCVDAQQSTFEANLARAEVSVAEAVDEVPERIVVTGLEEAATKMAAELDAPAVARVLTAVARLALASERRATTARVRLQSGLNGGHRAELLVEAALNVAQEEGYATAIANFKAYANVDHPTLAALDEALGRVLRRAARPIEQWSGPRDAGHAMRVGESEAVGDLDNAIRSHR